MKFSLDWLRSYVELPEEPARVAELLAQAGLPVDAIEAWGADHRFDVDVMANRPDCMGHLGLARELAARLGRELRRPAASVERQGPPAGEVTSVTVEAPEFCPRYTALVITGVKIGPSPDWLEDRLAAIGLRSVNNVVDVTNFVLHEYGQPLHAFDLDGLADHRIVVRRPRKGEVLQTLDGVAHRLEPDFLVIADADRPVALAGIMGGTDSEISPGTSRVLVESAHFDPEVTRRAAHRLQVHTDASHRFERGTDPGVTLEAGLRAAALIVEVAGGTVSPGDIDVGADKLQRRHATLSLRRLCQLLGLEVKAAQATRSLVSLGFEVEPPEWSGGDALFQVSIPTWRGDVSQEVDLIEEVARMVGYDAIPFTLPAFATEQAGLPGPSAGHDRARRYLVAAGYHEGLSFPMHDREKQSSFGAILEEGQSFVKLDNPLNQKMDTLRITLVPGLLEGVLHNLNRGVENVKLFELGRVFREAASGTPAPSSSRPGPTGSRLPIERTHAAIVARGAAAPFHWSRPARAIGFYDLKGTMEGLADSVFGKSCSVETSDPPLPFLATAEGGVVLLDGEPAGFIGRLAPTVAASYDLPDDIFLFEIDLTDLPPGPPQAAYRHPPRHPSSDRDLALILEAGTRYGQVEALIRQEGGDLLESVHPFDRYDGESIPAGKYSLAVRLSFRHTERTLTTEEVQAVQERIVARLASHLGARLRDASAPGGENRSGQGVSP